MFHALDKTLQVSMWEGTYNLTILHVYCPAIALVSLCKTRTVQDGAERPELAAQKELYA